MGHDPSRQTTGGAQGKGCRTETPGGPRKLCTLHYLAPPSFPPLLPSGMAPPFPLPPFFFHLCRPTLCGAPRFFLPPFVHPFLLLPPSPRLCTSPCAVQRGRTTCTWNLP